MLYHPTLPAPSDASAWFTAIGTLAVAVVALVSLLFTLSERRHRIEVQAESSFLRKSEQARKVGAQLSGGGGAPVQLDIINASDLTITHFEAVAIAMYPPGQMWKGSFFPPNQVRSILPGPAPTTQMILPSSDIDIHHHEIAFNDDNGLRWHKYGPGGLRQVPLSFTLLTNLSWIPSL